MVSETKPLSCLNRHWLDYRRNAERRGYKWELTKENFLDLVGQDCAYCGAKPKHKEYLANVGHGPGGTNIRQKVRSLEPVNGIDRKDNDVGYVLINCVPCCTTCNFLKKMLSAEQFIEHVLKIALYHDKERIK